IAVLEIDQHAKVRLGLDARALATQPSTIDSATDPLEGGVAVVEVPAPFPLSALFVLGDDEPLEDRLETRVRAQRAVECSKSVELALRVALSQGHFDDSSFRPIG